jgi:uncharacterized protein (TIGR02246 family)
MDIEAELAALTARVRLLEDIEAIRAVIAAYGPAADRGDAEGAAALWQDDGLYDVGGFGVSAGRTAIAALLEGPAHRTLIEGGAAHVLSPVSMALDGDHATATGYSCVFRWTGAAFEAHRISANRWMLVRTAAGWKVGSRVNRLLDGAEAARALLAGGGI